MINKKQKQYINETNKTTKTNKITETNKLINKR